MTSGRTLAELDVKPGDVVYYQPAGGARGSDRVYSEGDLWTSFPNWHLVSRANEPDKPKWGPWIGWNGGECPVGQDHLVECATYDKDYPLVREYYAGAIKWDDEARVPIIAYRIRIEPVRGDKTTYVDGVHLTFPTLDGNPIPGTYTNDNGDVITLEEIGDE